jgi:protein-tyrosine phosphatase
VCLGNICRSPSAEAVFRAKVVQEGLQDAVEIDSAGITGYHAGEPSDARMQKHAIKRGYRLTSTSRKVNAYVDFDYFDLIVGMDDQNIDDLRRLAPEAVQREKICKMTDFCEGCAYDEVPDPYYGGDAGFELVLDLLENACEGLLGKIKESRI